jgi:hypothetical protein
VRFWNNIHQVYPPFGRLNLYNIIYIYNILDLAEPENQLHNF